MKLKPLTGPFNTTGSTKPQDWHNRFHASRKQKYFKLDFHYIFLHALYGLPCPLRWTEVLCEDTPNTTEWFMAQWLNNDKPTKYVLLNIRYAHSRERLLAEDLDSKHLIGSWFMWPQTKCTWTHIFSLTNQGNARMLFPSVRAMCLSDLTYTGAIYLFSFCNLGT